MPIEAAPLESKGPDEPHLALLVDESGMRLAIPPGASLWLVEDKANQNKIYPLVLKKVSLNKIVFELRQPDGSASEYVYQLTAGKPLSRAAYKRMLENKQGQAVKFQK